MKLHLTMLNACLAICQLPNHAPIPDWASGSEFTSLTRTSEELSIVCDEKRVPEGVHCTKNWHAIKVDGPLGFDLIGILSELSGILAKAGVSIFVISTYFTDYILVQQAQINSAVRALQAAGQEVSLAGE